MSYTLNNPYVAKANSYKGQLHSHTTGSDGVDTPTALVTAYKNASYDFCVISDHVKATADPAVGGILFIPGVEGGTTTEHILETNTTFLQADYVAQNIIDGVTAAGGFTSLAHPDYPGSGWTDAEIAAIHDYTAIEIYNTLCVGTRGSSEGKWDTILSKNISCWGIAVDDCHNIGGAIFNKAWVHVFADSCTLVNITAALEAGNFYGSTGPAMTIALSGRTVTVTTPGESKIEWIINNGFITRTTLAATSDTYSIIGNENYVRVRITRDADSLMAWSNPITGLCWRLPQAGGLGGNGGMR